MALRFGTDGIRGLANRDLTPELALALGKASASVLGVEAQPFVVGRDTRRSGPMLQAAFSAGVASAGSSVLDLGVAPTPAVAFVAAERCLPAAMVSASHNPFADNGLKLFAPGGRKLTDSVEAALEAELDRVLAPTDAGNPAPTGRAVGSIDVVEDPLRNYGNDVLAGVPGGVLAGLAVVLDCAHGAAHRIGPLLLRQLGATVTVLGDGPDGTNINDGVGSTHLDVVRAAVLQQGAAVGLALDGDADRVLAVDERGEIVDGDQIIAMLALDRRQRGLLKDDTVVVTVMTNLGFHLAMRSAGVIVHQTAVGDRYVLEALERGGWSLGGEQSGHVITPEYATTGDGLRTGLAVLALMASSGAALSELAAVMHRLPQVLRNVAVTAPGVLESVLVVDEVKAVEASLGDQGRVLLRPSGTEPVVRVMVEAMSLETAEQAVARLCAAIHRATAAGQA